MTLYFVYKEKWCGYTENRGLVVNSSSENRAKGIAMAKGFGRNEPKSNIKVKELEPIEEGIICYTDYIKNSTDFN